VAELHRDLLAFGDKDEPGRGAYKTQLGTGKEVQPFLVWFAKT
jgi:hypothetical protein